MTAAITKVYRLRTGQGGFSATAADSADPYIVRVNEQVDHIKVMELFVSFPGAPIPKQTLKAFGSNYVVCDRYECRCVNTQRYLWELTVHWKELEDTQPQDQSSPFPNSNSVDPADWAPTVTRRAVTVNEPAQHLFYESGYGGTPHSEYSANTSATPPERSPFTNSAMVPFEDNLPPHQRKQSLWTIRWLRPTVPSDLTSYELKLNDTDVNFSHRGYTEFWEAKTAKIEAVSLSQTKWGSLQLWEIVVEILSDFDGHFITSLDQGLSETYYPGEPLPSGSSALVRTSFAIQDKNGKLVSEMKLLDGSGKALTTGPDVIAKWRDFELADFNAVPLLGDLITSAPPSP